MPIIANLPPLERIGFSTLTIPYSTRIEKFLTGYESVLTDAHNPTLFCCSHMKASYREIIDVATDVFPTSTPQLCLVHREWSRDIDEHEITYYPINRCPFCGATVVYEYKGQVVMEHTEEIVRRKEKVAVEWKERITEVKVEHRTDKVYGPDGTLIKEEKAW